MALLSLLNFHFNQQQGDIKQNEQVLDFPDKDWGLWFYASTSHGRTVLNAS